MKLKIVSNNGETHVYDAETGQEIHGITRVDIMALPHNVEATLTVFNPDIEFVLDGDHIVVETATPIKKKKA